MSSFTKVYSIVDGGEKDSQNSEDTTPPVNVTVEFFEYQGKDSDKKK